MSDFIHVVSTAVELLHGDVRRTDGRTKLFLLLLLLYNYVKARDNSNVKENIQMCLDIYSVLLPVRTAATAVAAL
jgi:hypothetical protein